MILETQIAQALNYLAAARVLQPEPGQPQVWADYLNSTGRFDWVRDTDLKTATKWCIAQSGQGTWVTVATLAKALDQIGNQRVSTAPPAITVPDNPTVYCQWLVTRTNGLRQGLTPTEAETQAWADIKQLAQNHSLPGRNEETLITHTLDRVKHLKPRLGAILERNIKK